MSSCFRNSTVIKNWMLIGNFSFLFSAKTLSVWKSIAHDPALKVTKKQYEKYLGMLILLLIFFRFTLAVTQQPPCTEITFNDGMKWSVMNFASSLTASAFPFPDSYLIHLYYVMF